MQKIIYIIAGCNGAGKTTASFTILPEILDCKEFVNADEIARGISPFQPESVAIEAGRIMLKRINELISENQNFAFETTLASKIYKNKIIEAKKNGYKVFLIFFWMSKVEIAKSRVKNRYNKGGHLISEEVIDRRFRNGIINLFDVYIPIVDSINLVDNTYGRYQLIARRKNGGLFEFLNEKKFDQLKTQYERFRK